MRRAVIDIGTNTVKLLVADVDGSVVTPVFATDRTTRLGEGIGKSTVPPMKFDGRNPPLTPPRRGTANLDSPPPEGPGVGSGAQIVTKQTSVLSRVAIARTVECVSDFLDEARRRGATDIIALATAAARDAGNRDELLDGVQCKCGLTVEVISDEREAELIFRGVCTEPAFAGEPLLVLDVGGGSAELVAGKDGKVERWVSLPLGAVRLTEKFGEDVARLTEYLRDVWRERIAGFDARGRRFVGTGGTVVTMARVEPAALTIDGLRALVMRLHGMPLAERKQMPGLPPERADIIVAGGMVFVTAMEMLGARELTVSNRNLRYGALMV